MSDQINIDGLSKPQLFANLYNNAREQTYAYGTHQARNITLKEARDIIRHNKSLVFTRVGGRILNISLEGKTVDPSAYDLQNGEGKAKRVIEAVRASPVPEAQPSTSIVHRLGARLHSLMAKP